MSSSPFSSASLQLSSGTVRVMSRRSQSGSAFRSASTACSKWRRLAFTEPKTTSFSSTSSLIRAPTSTLRLRDAATPDRQTIARGAVEHVDLELALHAHEGGEQADRAGPGHEHALVDRARARRDAVDLLPGLGEDARRLGEDAERPEVIGYRDGEVLLDRHELGAVAVERLDAALRVLAVPAHVPLAHGAAGARDGVGAPDDPGHQLAGVEAAASLADTAEELVPEHEPLVSLRRLAVGAVEDLAVGAADAEVERLDEQLAILWFGLGQVDQLGTVRVPGDHCDGSHS